MDSSKRAFAESHATPARQLVRSGSKAALATSLARDRQRPHSSLVVAATTVEGEPLLLLSDLAVHTQNIAADPRVALLYDGGGDHDGLLSGSRVSILGSVVSESRDAIGERYLRRYPEAREYLEFGDFRMYRVEVRAAHLVAGFGAIHWLEPTDVMVSDTAAFAEAEAGLLAILNADCQPWTLPEPPAPEQDWTLTGIDPEGADFRSGSRFRRLSFDQVLRDPNAASRHLREMIGADPNRPDGLD